jgi:hypothetical protein
MLRSHKSFRLAFFKTVTTSRNLPSYMNLDTHVAGGTQAEGVSRIGC